MPIYEYECGQCHHQLEALQKISDKPLRECPECGRRTLKRLVSAPLFRLAGSGWYETDFKSDKETKRNLAGKEEAPAASESPASKDDKPATTETKPAESKPAVTTPEPGKKTTVSKPVVSASARSKSTPAVKKAVSKKPARRR